ncbi:hypothetical protein ACS0TY_015533 [Phlomoides rotata]
MVKGRQGERVRLYVRGTVLGYKRSKSNQYPNTSLVQIEGVNTQEEVEAELWGRRCRASERATVERVGAGAPVYLSAVLEYFVAETNLVRALRFTRI